jgi:hypothetical protein
MNREGLRYRLEQERIIHRAYSLFGLLDDDNRFILDKEQDKWVVYYFERGERIDQKTFEAEEEACQYFLNWILRYPELKRK